MGGSESALTGHQHSSSGKWRIGTTLHEVLRDLPRKRLLPAIAVGAKSFGKGNFKALFEAIEREQENRGML